MTPPALTAAVLRVADPAADAEFYRRHFDAGITDGPRPGWVAVDTGWDTALLLAPGDADLPVYQDRWERQGVIPILRTWDIDAAVKRLDDAGVTWINRPFEYDMKGHALLGYFHDPAGQPIGLQQRMDDSVREEDLAALARLDGPAPAVTGIGWVIFQAADIVAARDFYAALGWRERRGTEGFGYMMALDEIVTLQIAFRGRAQDPARDLAAEPVLGLLSGVDPDAVVAAGGTLADGPDGYRAFLDPEGHAWLFEGES
nr:hypothetical protein GCM10020063_007110 [Dactylosporangium thailandense]